MCETQVRELPKARKWKQEKGRTLVVHHELHLGTHGGRHLPGLIDGVGPLPQLPDDYPEVLIEPPGGLYVAGRSHQLPDIATCHSWEKEGGGRARMRTV